MYGQSLLKNYTTQDGLPDSRVSPIIQDSKGYMWFGTQAGLTRYDGSQFVNFAGAKDIPGIFGRAIMEDHRGAIWFAYTGFAHGGVLRLWNGTVTDFSNALAGTESGCVAEDHNHDVWIGSNAGLSRIRFTDSSRTAWTVTQLPEYLASALFVDSKGILWIGCSDGNVYSYMAGQFTLVIKRLSSPVRAHAIYESKSGAIWFGGVFGAMVIDNGTLHKFKTVDGLPVRGVWSFREDNSGNFWVGTAEGLRRLKMSNGQLKFIKEKSFGDAVVYDICLDTEGNVWFASDPGVRKLLASDFIVDFAGKNILATSGFGPIVQHPDGTIYFGSRNAGIFTLNANTIRRGSQVQPVVSLTVLAIFPEPPSRIWYGIKKGGIRLRNGAVTLEYDIPEGVSVHAFEHIADGRLLIGTSSGLNLADQNTDISHLSHPDLDSLTIFDIAHDPKTDQYWLGTDKGVRLVRLAGNSVAEVQTVSHEPLSSSIIYTIFVDNRQQLWFGTDGGGLIKYDGTTFTAFKKDDGLVGDRVYALAQDSLGLLWIGTSTGLSQFDGTSFRNFTHDQGFGEIGLRGLMVDGDGALWVSNFPGITKIRPQKFYKSKRLPPIYIADMQVDTVHFSEGKTAEISPDPAVITFRYAGLSFTDEVNVRYKYKLEGFDNDWSAPVTHREVRYTHLPGGRYTFRVIARSVDGVWSQSPAEISFTILPPVWARWWFIVGAVVLVAAAAYGFYRYSLEKALQLERTRSRIAMDLHDDIGSSLTRISVLSEVAQRQDDARLEARSETVARIGETARELIDSLGDIVWSVDPHHDDLQNVIRRIVEFGDEMCAGKGITFETDIEAAFDQTRLSLEQRRDVYLVFKEAVSNVIKHSRATLVRFAVRQKNSTAVLELVDNGIGYDRDSSGGGHGLASMYERARRSGVNLEIMSHPGKGTKTTLEMKTV